MVFMGMEENQRKTLELELISREVRLKLTRLVRSYCLSEYSDVHIGRMNRYINIANSVLGNPIYVLEPYDGEYEPAEYSWHNGQLELLWTRPSTVELIEILADLIENELLEMHAINKILEDEQCSFRFDYGPKSEVYVEVDELSKVPDEKLSADHPSIRKLCERMDRAVEAEDPAAVLHSAASIFETLAKDILANPKIDNQPLGGFFEKYRKTSQLPDKILDYVKQVYKARNSTPLAGHGSTQLPKITVKDAIVLAEMTKAIVRSERKLINWQTTAKKNHRN